MFGVLFSRDRGTCRNEIQDTRPLGHAEFAMRFFECRVHCGTFCAMGAPGREDVGVHGAGFRGSRHQDTAEAFFLQEWFLNGTGLLFLGNTASQSAYLTYVFLEPLHTASYIS